MGASTRDPRKRLKTKKRSYDKSFIKPNARRKASGGLFSSVNSASSQSNVAASSPLPCGGFDLQVDDQWIQ
jgi:hypothetical protein